MRLFAVLSALAVSSVAAHAATPCTDEALNLVSANVINVGPSSQGFLQGLAETVRLGHATCEMKKVGGIAPAAPGTPVCHTGSGLASYELDIRGTDGARIIVAAEVTELTSGTRSDANVTTFQASGTLAAQVQSATETADGLEIVAWSGGCTRPEHFAAFAYTDALLQEEQIIVFRVEADRCEAVTHPVTIKRTWSELGIDRTAGAKASISW